MKRRDFLKRASIMPLVARSSLLGTAMLTNIKKAYAANGKSLIVIFQRGGCDGLNVTVPYGEDEYYNLRPDIAIPAPSASPDSALDLDGFFGLHPAATGLYDIYQKGDLAILPTVHYSNANRSHFSSQDFIESGMANQALPNGWLNRYLSSSSTNNNNTIRALSFTELAHSLQGNTPVPTVSTLSTPNDQFNELQINTLQKILNQSVSNKNQAHTLIHKHGKLALKDLSNLETFTNITYTPENGATYPDTNYGQQLKNIAQLIKADIGLEVTTVSSNNWDTHANQGGVTGDQATKLTDFSDGINALYTDLGSVYMSDVTILTVTEFGRTAKQNASLGTDHGNASTWFVIGKQVNGGIYGTWPGLMPDQLYKGRYLEHTIEFTDIYADLIKNHLSAGENLPFILPGGQYQPIGILS